jgi:hypothetical protein
MVRIAAAVCQRTVNASVIPSGDGRGSARSRPDKHISTVITTSPCYVSEALAKPLWNESPRCAKLVADLSDPEQKGESDAHERTQLRDRHARLSRPDRRRFRRLTAHPAHATSGSRVRRATGSCGSPQTHTKQATHPCTKGTTMYSSNLLYQRQIASDRQQLLLRQAGASRLRREIRQERRRTRSSPSG